TLPDTPSLSLTLPPSLTPSHSLTFPTHSLTSTHTPSHSPSTPSHSLTSPHTPSHSLTP
uniref:uncharacterized protein n=1 Tax=Pristiophorus japonicus TaxID=55135 RepID=UPI00398F0801